MVKQFADTRNRLEYLAFVCRQYGRPTVAYMTTSYPKTEGQWLAHRLAMRLYAKRS